MKAVRFHRLARVELDAAVAYFESCRSGLGLELDSEIERVVARIAIAHGKRKPGYWARRRVE